MCRSPVQESSLPIMHDVVLLIVYLCDGIRQQTVGREIRVFLRPTDSSITIPQK